MDDTNTNEGGRAALAGYLYQILGTHAIAMRAWTAVEDAAPDAAEMDALITLAGEGYVLHEVVGQDIGIIREDGAGGQKASLVQLKYSRVRPAPAISPSELQEIVAALLQSTRWAEKQGVSVSEYFLVTNRLLSAQATALKESAEREVGPVSFTTKKKGEVKEVVLTGPQKEALRKLQLRNIGHIDVWVDQLRSFARTYGVEDRDIDDGINKLVGYLARQTEREGATAVARSNIVAAFTGNSDTQQLISQSVAPIAKTDLDRQRRHLHLQPHLVRRPVMEDLARLATTRALIVLEGLGGCGKTATLWNHADELTVAAAQKAGPLAAIVVARYMRSNWVTKLICGWGRVRADHEWHNLFVDRSLGRLHIANPDVSPPLLYLGIDGLDEGVSSPTSKQAIDEVLAWFFNHDEEAVRTGRPPLATLIVTCRDRKEAAKEWPYLEVDAAGYPAEGEEAPSSTITVGDFSVSELLEAAEQFLTPPLVGRLARTMGLVSEPKLLRVRTLSLRTVGATDEAAPLIDVEILAALRHPVMWQALLSLSQEERDVALNGEQQGRHQLANAFIEWFCDKAHRRNDYFRQDEVFDVLKAVAGHTQPAAEMTHRYESDWKQPACATDIVDRLAAKALYHEALSAGVIVKDSPPTAWRWRHQFVREYLTAATPHEGAVGA